MNESKWKQAKTWMLLLMWWTWNEALICYIINKKHKLDFFTKRHSIKRFNVRLQAKFTFCLRQLRLLTTSHCTDEVPSVCGRERLLQTTLCTPSVSINHILWMTRILKRQYVCWSLYTPYCFSLSLWPNNRFYM